MKGRMTRSFSDGWDKFMAGFANEKKITCPICRKYIAWVSEGLNVEVFKKGEEPCSTGPK